MAKLETFLRADDQTASLVEYIESFELPIAVMQTVPALERTTYELCLDLAKDNVQYAEIRFGPWLRAAWPVARRDHPGDAGGAGGRARPRPA